MSLKDRLFQAKASADRKHQVTEDEKRSRELAEVELWSRYPKIEAVKANEVSRIVQIVDRNVSDALMDFGEVMWGSGMAEVSAVPGKVCHEWLSAPKGSRSGTETTYHEDGTQRYLGYTRVCRVKLEILSVAEDKLISRFGLPVAIGWNVKTQKEGKGRVQKEFGNVVWQHGFGWFDWPDSRWSEPLGKFDFCAVVGIGGVDWADTVVKFGFDEHSYVERLERGLEIMVKRSDKLSEHRESPPHSYEH